MIAQSADRDERTLAVENAGYRWSSYVLSFGLLLLVAYRSFANGESNWDLLALVIVAGAVNAIYQGTRKVLYQRWVVMSAVTFAIAAVLAGVMVLARGAR